METSQQSEAEELRDRSTGELFGRLSTQTSELIRQEIKLAQVEMTEKGKQAGKGAGLLGGAGALGYLALAAITVAVIALIDKATDLWVAALIVAVVYAAVAAALASAGRKKLQEATPPPEHTVETIKEDVQWAKNQSRSAGR